MSLSVLDPIKQLETPALNAGIRPGDADYETARQTWNLSVDQRPAMIVMAHNSEDVAAAVRYAEQANLPVAVQATGHGVRKPADGALLINTAQMTDVRVDAEDRTAWVAAGAAVGECAGPGADRRAGSAAGFIAHCGRGRLHVGRRTGLAGADNMAYLRTAYAGSKSSRPMARCAGLARKSMPIFSGVCAVAAAAWRSSPAWRSNSIRSLRSTAATWSIRRRWPSKCCCATVIGSRRCQMPSPRQRPS